MGMVLAMVWGTDPAKKPERETTCLTCRMYVDKANQRGNAVDSEEEEGE